MKRIQLSTDMIDSEPHPNSMFKHVVIMIQTTEI